MQLFSCANIFSFLSKAIVNKSGGNQVGMLSFTMTANGLRIDVGGLSKLPLSIHTNG